MRFHAEGLDPIEDSEPLARGTFNSVHAVPGRPDLLLRRTREGQTETLADMERELAYMTLMHDLGVQPALVAAGVWPSSRDRGSSASLLKRGVSLADWLDAGGSEAEGAAAAQSLLRQFCVVSDAGFCLVDVKPGNAIMAGQEVKLIDFDPYYTIFMDPELIRAFKLMARDDGFGAECARARGMSLYIMTLLFYLYAHDKFEPTPRVRGLLAVLRAALSSACVPLDVLADLRDARPGSLAEALQVIVEHYFFRGQGDVLKALAQRATRERLRAVGCGGAPWDVHVLGVTYSNDAVSCRDRGAELRHGVVASVNGRKYPCPGKAGLPSSVAALGIVGRQVLRRSVQGADSPLRVPELRRSRSPKPR
jgi:hypothetical protein